jgi:hypothetical protein
VWAALQSLTPADLPVTRLLMGIRSMRLPQAGDGARSLWESMPIPLLREDPPSYALAAGIGRPWSLSGMSLTMRVEDIITFTEPGWAKLATDFRLTAAVDGTVLTTQTRVLTTDPVTRLKFGAYWALIRPFSGLIRREMLRAVDHAARRRTRPRPRSPRPKRRPHTLMEVDHEPDPAARRRRTGRTRQAHH